jgi:hypothetical protein
VAHLEEWGKGIKEKEEKRKEEERYVAVPLKSVCYESSGRSVRFSNSAFGHTVPGRFETGSCLAQSLGLGMVTTNAGTNQKRSALLCTIILQRGKCHAPIQNQWALQDEVLTKNQIYG